jgi:hypothetical protein
MAEDLRELLRDLKQADGRPPDMLILMAIGAGLAMRERSSDSISEDVFMREHVGEVAKHLGYLVVEAMHQFGFNEETFRDYVRAEWQFDFGQWPPSDVAFEHNPPA